MKIFQWLIPLPYPIYLLLTKSFITHIFSKRSNQRRKLTLSLSLSQYRRSQNKPCCIESNISVKKAMRVLKLLIMNYEVLFISDLLISAYVSALHISVLLRYAPRKFHVNWITWLGRDRLSQIKNGKLMNINETFAKYTLTIQ